MHRRIDLHRSALRCARLFSIALALSFPARLFAAAARPTAPVWIVSNGFHTSLALRIRDVPFAAKITGDRRANVVLFGWGAGDFYRGHANPWTLFTAIIGANQSVLHIVPVRGSLTARFPHSDIIQLDLPRPDVRILAAEIDRAFALDSHRERIAAGRGYYPESRFYAGRERFYFPKMCNVWVAQKLRRSGVPVTASAALIASDLVRQTEKLGHRLHSRRRPADAF